MSLEFVRSFVGGVCDKEKGQEESWPWEDAQGSGTDADLDGTFFFG